MSSLPPPELGDRALFPSLRPWAYLNHAAVSPPSAAVERAAHEFLASTMKEGVGAIGHWIRQRERLRSKLAAFLGATPEGIGFVPNTTRGVIDVALCLPWKKGDRVIVFEGEFPANVTPWQRAAEHFGLELVQLPIAPFERCHEEGLETLQTALAEGARLVAVSFVQFQTGLRMPLRAIADAVHRAGGEIFIDAIQGVGAIPFDVEAIDADYVTCGGHKFMMGLEGAGFVYVRPTAAARLVPRVAGWLSHEEGLRFLFEGAGHLRYDRAIKARAELFEGGAQSAIGYAALEASLDLLVALTPERIFAHVTAYLDALEPGLRDLGFESARAVEADAHSASLSVRPPAGHDLLALHRVLGERGVAVSTPDGWLRFAPHWPSSLDEVPRIVRAVEESLGVA